MKVTFSQHGGQAAGILLNRPPLVVDAAALDASKAAELKDLVAALASAKPPAERSAKTRDEMSYTINIEDGGRTTTLSQSDTQMSAEFGSLVAWLKRQSR